MLPVKCLRLALLLTSLFRHCLPIFSQLSAALGCCTNKAWGLSQGYRIMPRQRPLVPYSSSWILPLCAPPSSAFPPVDSRNLLQFQVAPFLVRSITCCDKKKAVLLWFARLWELDDFAVSGTPVPKKSFHYPRPSPMRPNKLWTCPGAARVCPSLSTALVAGSVRRGREGDRYSLRRN